MRSLQAPPLAMQAVLLPHYRLLPLGFYPRLSALLKRLNPLSQTSGQCIMVLRLHPPRDHSRRADGQKQLPLMSTPKTFRAILSSRTLPLQRDGRCKT